MWERISINVPDQAHVVKYLTDGVRPWLEHIFPKVTHVVLHIDLRHVTDEFFNFLMELLRSCRRLKHASLELDYFGPHDVLHRIQDILSTFPTNLLSLYWHCLLLPGPDGEVFYALRRFSTLRTLIIRIYKTRDGRAINRKQTLECMLDGGPIQLPHLEYLGFFAPELFVVHPGGVWSIPQVSHWHTSFDQRLFTQDGLSFPSVTHVNLSGYMRITTEMIETLRNSIATIFPALQHLAYSVKTNLPIIYENAPWHWIARGLPQSLESITLFPSKGTPWALDTVTEEALLAHLNTICFKRGVTLRLEFYTPPHTQVQLREFANAKGIVWDENY